MNREKINKLTRAIYNKYDPLRYQNAYDCVMPGYFGGNDVMFVAQNPGELKDSVVGDIAYLDAYSIGDLPEMEIRYIQALKSDRGTYGIFINDIYGADWDKISITNVFKCPFTDNRLPKAITEEIPEREVKILQRQIEYVNPKLIVAVGAIAKKCIKQMKGYNSYNIDAKTIYVHHPSYLKRIGLYETKVDEYKKLLSTALANATTKSI